MYKTLVRFLFVALMVVGMTVVTGNTASASCLPGDTICFKSNLWNYSSYYVVVCSEGPGQTCVSPILVAPGQSTYQFLQGPDVDLFTFVAGQGISSFDVYYFGILRFSNLAPGTLIDVTDFHNVFCWNNGNKGWCNVY
jgi:hypothetical protein